jgi:WS/DGAT/MGAT family acyltransferase
MQRLTGLDAVFLYMETPNNHMHVASTGIFDPSTVPEGYSFDKVKELVRDRLPLLPPFRRRLVTIPFELHHPLWIEDPDFDLDYHVRRAALPAPGGQQELAEFAAEVMSRPLDRSRPLWEMYVIEGLENGLIAVVTKTHHAAIDGVSGAELTVNLLDLQPEPAPVPEQEKPWKPDKVPSDIELVGYALSSLARQPLLGVKALRRTVGTVLNTRRRNRQPDVNPPPGFFSAPRTSMNVAVSPRRRFAFTEVTLDDIKMVKNALGGTVNDVVLAICSGALRAYFAEQGEKIEGPLQAMVPISVRTEDQKGAMGNQVASMLVSLASDVADPAERLHTITEGTKGAKEQEKAIGAATLTGDWAEFAAPALAARAARLAARTRVLERLRPLFNVTISNVPGPPFPLYSAGARMVALYPMGPVMDGAALNITVMSYMSTVYFGLMADRDAVSRVWDIARLVDSALVELKKAADDAVRPAPRPAAKPAPKPKAAAKPKATVQPTAAVKPDDGAAPES